MCAAKASAKKAQSFDILKIGMDLIAESGWRGLTFQKIADRTGMPLIDVYRRVGGHGALLSMLADHLDQAMLGFDRRELDGLPARDRLFELIMQRLDAMAPFRPGLSRLASEATRTPDLALMSICRLDPSMAWLQDAAGLGRHGLRARLQRRMLLIVYLQTLHVWCKDDTADLAKTMAALDQNLRRIEPFAGFGDPKTSPSAPSAQPA